MFFCILRCVTSVLLLQKVLEHAEQSVTVCILRCVASAGLLWMALQQVEHNVLLYS